MSNNKLYGVDEAGRGPWAGPLIVAVVLASTEQLPQNITDSKRLSEAKRLELLRDIQTISDSIGVGWVDNAYIDRYGLSAGLKKASKLAFSSVTKLKTNIIVDGNYNFTAQKDDVMTMIKADQKIIQVSAASIVAKVLRDNWMRVYAEKYPQWGFDKHYGYGTKKHKDAIEKNGLSPIHRLSFKPIRQHHAYVQNR